MKLYQFVIILVLAVLLIGWQINQSSLVPIRVQVRGPQNIGTMGGVLAPFPVLAIGLIYQHIATAGTYVIKPTSGVLNHVVINDPLGNVSNFSLYDVAGASCPGFIGSAGLVASITIKANDSSHALDYGVLFNNGICGVLSSANADLTVVFDDAVNF